MLPGKLPSILIIIVILTSVISCGEQPSQLQPQPTSFQAVGGGAPVSLPTATPHLPTRTRTFTPHPPPTLTPLPTAPSNVNLPPIPDFRGTVITSGLGGGPLCDDLYNGPFHVHGAANSFVPARTGYLCVYGPNFDTSFRVELTAPDNSITLGEDYFPSSGDFGIYWRDFNLGNFGSIANWLGGSPPGDIILIGQAYTRYFIKIRWRGDLPDGNWRIRVLSNGNEFTGDFTAIAPEYPSITALDSRENWIIPSYFTCHFADQPQDLSALAEGYPPNRDVYLYVYEQNDGLVLHSVVRTDELGSFYTGIPGPYRQDGKYFLIGSLEPLTGANLPQGNMMDCFYVP